MPEQSTLPILIERAQVPSHFPLFRNTAALAHLAHSRKGPPYILVGGRAWYDVADIKAWLEQNKKVGPTEEQKKRGDSEGPAVSKKKRGRPTKREQYYRGLRQPRTADR